MKLFAFAVAAGLWIAFMVFLVWRRPRQKISGDVGAGKGVVHESQTRAIEVRRDENILTIQIDPFQLTNKIELTMDTKENQITMNVGAGALVHEPNPEPDVNEEEVLTPSHDVDEIMLAQIEELAKEGKVILK